jgi:4-hydroxy-3-methylbut-2-en-1-yl diphosphate reductase
MRMKTFDIPEFYRSPLISAIKQFRKAGDKMKKDFSPTKLDFGPVEFYLARHFGFCYGVENAIEIAFRTVNENPGKRIFLLSEMIHNPKVNQDLLGSGVRFIMDTHGKHYIQWSELKSDDIVIIPAFGTTLETEQLLRDKGIDPLQYNTTCPFVEKVWNRSEQIGEKGYTIIIHGKPQHEETRATFSHSSLNAPSVVVKDMDEARKLEKYILKKTPANEFYNEFKGQFSDGFDAEKDFDRIGVVNQTTMLASDTQAIADYLKKIVEQLGADRFADTRDTLCYATNDNQQAVSGMLETQADLAIVVGGYNSSNTSHLVELCEHKLPTYYIENAGNIHADGSIQHYLYQEHREINSPVFLPQVEPVRILLTSGASCPDAIVEQVIANLLTFFPSAKSMTELEHTFQ